MYLFQCDYTGGCHPAILRLLNQTNEEELPGYCEDEICQEAADLIRKACSKQTAEASVFWLTSGTLANLSVLSAALRSNEAVIATDTAHIFTAEAGAIEACGFQIKAVKNFNGKISAQQIEELCLAYEQASEIDRSHMTRPKAVYLSYPTELGTVYSKEELTAISEVSKKHNLFLYLDGARLAYGLALEELSLRDIARLTDAFYIGGTKCGALIGEAVVITQPEVAERYLGVLRMRGGLVAKGRIVGCAFKAFFTDHLYENIGKDAVQKAQKIQKAFLENGVKFDVLSPTNQIFPIVDLALMKVLSKSFRFKVMKQDSQGRYLLRFCTSWSTTDASVEALINQISQKS